MSGGTNASRIMPTGDMVTKGVEDAINTEVRANGMYPSDAIEWKRACSIGRVMVRWQRSSLS